jgi:hypothetical protein
LSVQIQSEPECLAQSPAEYSTSSRQVALNDNVCRASSSCRRAVSVR